MMAKKIIIPVDGSESSRFASGIAGIISRNEDCDITFVHIVPVLNELMRNEAEDVIRNSANLAEISKYSMEIRGGKPSDIVMKIINEKNPDLVVVGSRGSRSLQDSVLGRSVLGGVSDAVLRTAKCDVVVVKSGSNS